MANIKIAGACKSFGHQRVLDEIDLEVASGTVTVIIGPSGSGKSTLLRCINHLERIEAGTIQMDGNFIGYRRKDSFLYELKDRDIAVQRKKIGMVFQQFNLFPHWQVLRNITEGPVSIKGESRKSAIARARRLLRQVGLEDKERAWPRQLSGGQQQRVAIARALAMEPELMLFDEPTSALDPELVGEVLATIRELATSGMTMIVVTHEIGFAREVADQVVFMDEGRVVETGSAKQVLDAPRNPRTQAFLASVLE